MALIIDTYNCTHAGTAMGGAFADLTVRKLCQFLICAPSRSKTTLVIDGRPKPEEPGENEFPELHLLYSGAGIKADKVIDQMVERSQNRKNLTVVTNDRAVVAAARRRGAETKSCETFLLTLLAANNAGRKLGEGKSAGKPATQKTTGKIDPSLSAHWLKEFGITPAPDAPKKKSSDNNPDDLDMKNLMGF